MRVYDFNMLAMLGIQKTYTSNCKLYKKGTTVLYVKLRPLVLSK